MATEMTSLERVDALLAGKQVDRIPCHPFIGDHAATVLGVPVSDYHRSARLMAKAQVAAWRLYGHDWVGVGPVLGIAEAVGTVFHYPEQAAPYIVSHAIADPVDLDSAVLPDVADPRIALYLEAVQAIHAEIGDRVPVSLNVRSPFSTAANLRGAEELMRDLMYRPAFAHRLLRFALDATLPVLEAAPAGIRFGTSDPVASGSLISPRHYREFAKPYEQELLAAMRRISGSPGLLHICGNTKKVWADMADTGAGFLSLDDVVDMAAAKEAIGDRAVLVGNVRPTESMFLGTPELVRENVRECVAAAGDAPGGFMLAVGCGLPIPTPPANVHALVQAAKEFGSFAPDREVRGAL
ncbi:uroporphyrinogen decarboxylase family protein [Geomonas subterranea]|uniref:Uroporphyrinogen decarboxylase family protein n=1 Tax=Geomonas subterranea TaxID=2847989 RepID=A0ABX8LI92_9BACT|nr:uroporphyrinogen decarboxylase family protein [Geomonas subterranea]QXE91397.1 uroporphyrinogen decarboxylase family protein [Geomonas subterranea]QXM10515.1 uroporphyrinogen decarboxylase family protein [Geomonas subterranea]